MSSPRVHFDEIANTINDPTPSSSNTLNDHGRPQKRSVRKSPRNPTVYGYYVEVYEIHEQKHGRNSALEGDIFETFKEFRRTLCRETGLPNNYLTFCEVGGSGYCIALARNLPRKAPRSLDLEALVQKMKRLLKTEEEPKWYYEEV
jgi:hypothetical protein